jgi:hypothetical protein
VEEHRWLLAALAQLSDADKSEAVKIQVGRFRERLKLTEALILNQNMKDVWASLDRRRKQYDERLPKPFVDPPLPHRLEGPEMMASMANIEAKRKAAEAALRSPALRLLDACDSALQGFEVQPKLDTASAKAHYRRIAQHSEALADLLPRTHWQHVRDYLDIGAQALYPSSVKSMAAMLRLNADSVLHKFFEEAPDDWILGASDPWANLPAFLRRLATLASERAKYPSKIVAQLNSPGAKLRYFQIETSRHFMRAYGQPLHKQVADIASAVFSVNLSAENVRKLITYRERRADPEKTTG